MNKELVNDLKNRRNDRYDALFIRLKSFSDNSKFYSDKIAEAQMFNAFELFKKATKKESYGNKENTIYTRWLDVKSENRDDFIDEIIQNIREANEIYIEKELKETEKNLTKNFIEHNINYVEKNSRNKYYGAIKMLLHLDKIAKINILENELRELQKDFISCINYNSKIKHAIEENAECVGV